MGAHLLLALGTAHARADRVVGPADRRAAVVVAVEQVLQCGTAGPVHRQQLVDPVGHGRSVAQHQLHVVVDPDARRAQGLGVGGQLQQGLDLDRTGELGVAQPVALSVEHQEVGETDEAAVEHRGLVDDLRAIRDRAQRRLRGSGQAGHRVGGSADDRDMAARTQLVEVTLLVLIAEFGGAGQQLVGDRDGRPPAEAGIERTQQRVLAARGSGEVGCAVDDSIVGDEHYSTPSGHKRTGEKTNGLRQSAESPQQLSSPRPSRPQRRPSRHRTSRHRHPTSSTPSRVRACVATPPTGCGYRLRGIFRQCPGMPRLRRSGGHAPGCCLCG